MKKILYHFRISVMLGTVILASITMPLPVKFSKIPNPKFETKQQVDQDEGSGDIDESEGSNTENPEIPEIPDEPVLDYQYDSELIINAVNPGYTVDGTRDVGEFIELKKISDNTSLPLASYAIKYVNSSGKDTLLLDFSEGSLLAGETLLVRLARSPESDRADATYMTTLAMGSGRVELLNNGQIVDYVCWGSKECSPAFKSANPTTLVRNLTTGLFEHMTEYAPFYDPDHPSLVLPPEPEDPGESDTTIENPDDGVVENSSITCLGIEFSEIYTYYANSKTEQFIELYNPTERDVALNNCMLRYKNKSYNLSGIVEAGKYHVIYTSQDFDLSLTKNPSSSNIVELVGGNNDLVDVLVYQHGQKKSASFAKFYDSSGEDTWQLTYDVTPGRENTYQEFRTCTDGKVINPATGNCVKATDTTAAIKECAEGQYRNPLTGRCKKIEAETEAKPCAEGYERNPSTGRCRKVVSPNDGADYALIPETYSSKSTFTAFGIVLLIVSLGMIYIILQFRREILRAMRKARQRIYDISKDLISRCRSIGRDQKP